MYKTTNYYGAWSAIAQYAPSINAGVIYYPEVTDNNIVYIANKVKLPTKNVRPSVDADAWSQMGSTLVSGDSNLTATMQTSSIVSVTTTPTILSLSISSNTYTIVNTSDITINNGTITLPVGNRYLCSVNIQGVTFSSNNLILQVNTLVNNNISVSASSLSVSTSLPGTVATSSVIIDTTSAAATLKFEINILGLTGTANLSSNLFKIQVYSL